MDKRKVRPVKVGQYTLGDGSITVQSMLSVHPSDIEGNVKQAVELYKAGCEILRVAIPNEDAIKLIPAIKAAVAIPLVADIHFDYRLALKSIEAGIDKIRINPGNIGDDERVKAVVDACKAKNIPIRIGVNSGSVEKHILKKYGSPTPQALVESALYHTHLLEKFDFYDTVISIKSSNVKTTIEAYRLLAKECEYPLHLGVTEAGTAHMGILKNAIGIGSLLCDGIGDTIRVSLTANPVEEISAGYDILKACGVRQNGVEIVSCPTCGRTQIDLISLTKAVEDKLKDCKKNIKVAVMGCVVNGPGEAKEADVGVAGGLNCGVIFKKGEIVKTVPEEEILNALLAEIDKL
ncbi:MAG: flavodoxin-dependent (E)-4-hydroxy-3-methylbut-2-enyl-diphosphate synthase [Oscillospiraceae bacterium]